MADDLNTDPIITITLKKGLADRHRVPLGDVLSVLDELRLMIAEVGRRLQRERGVVNPSGDFGLEMIATDGPSLFRKGSVQMPIAITVNAETGILATQEVLRTFAKLESDNGVPEPNSPIDRSILRRISRVASVQRRDHMELELGIHRPGFAEPFKATFGRSGMDTLKAIQTKTFQVEGMTVYGKLIQLIDHDLNDGVGNAVWGELIRSDGESWRVQFKADQIEAITPLFARQVQITGTAVYYRVATPKIIVNSIVHDAERDLENAFDESFGSYKGAFDCDLNTLVKRMRED
jgi:hypothetical protein